MAFVAWPARDMIERAAGEEINQRLRGIFLKLVPHRTENRQIPMMPPWHLGTPPHMK
jgi:hypothetical protein